MAYKQFKVEPYGVVVVVNKQLPKDIKASPVCMGLTWTDKHDDFVVNVWLNPLLLQRGKTKKDQKLLDKEKLKFVVHECVHVKQFIEEAVDTKLDIETEAYLVSYLSDEVLKRLA